MTSSMKNSSMPKALQTALQMGRDSGFDPRDLPTILKEARTKALKNHHASDER